MECRYARLGFHASIGYRVLVVVVVVVKALLHSLGCAPSLHIQPHFSAPSSTLLTESGKTTIYFLSSQILRHKVCWILSAIYFVEDRALSVLYVLYPQGTDVYVA